MAPKRKFSTKRRSFKKRTFKRKRKGTFKRRTFKKRSFKRRHHGVSKKGGKPAMYKKKFGTYKLTVGKDPSMKGRFRVATLWGGDGGFAGGMSATVAINTPIMVPFNFVANSVDSVTNKGLMQTGIASKYVPPRGLQNRLYNRFVNSIVEGSSLKFTIAINDTNIDYGSWHLLITPLTYAQMNNVGAGTLMFPVGPLTAATAFLPNATVSSNVPLTYANQKLMPRTKEHIIMGFASGKNKATAYIKMSMDTMNSEPAWRTNSGNWEQNGVGLNVGFRNYYHIGLYNLNPTGSGTLQFDVAMEQVWWVSTFEPMSQSLIQGYEAKAEAYMGHLLRTACPPAESKEEKDEAMQDTESEEAKDYAAWEAIARSPRPFEPLDTLDGIAPVSLRRSLASLHIEAPRTPPGPAPQAPPSTRSVASLRAAGPLPPRPVAHVRSSTPALQPGLQ